MAGVAPTARGRAASLGRQRFGFSPEAIGRLLVLPSTTAARRRVDRSADVLDTAFPSRGARVRYWLREPSGDLAGILFLSDTNGSGGTYGHAGPKRVRTGPGTTI